MNEMQIFNVLNELSSDEDLDPVNFGLPVPILFSTDYNMIFILDKIFKPESTNSSLDETMYNSLRKFFSIFTLGGGSRQNHSIDPVL